MSDETKSKGGVWQFIKFALFSASAGIIQILSFTLMSEVIIKLPFLQNLMETNRTFSKIMSNEYGPMYLIALLLSVIWNFTFNRKFTFKSAANVPIAMLKVLAFYCVFTPVSTLLGNYFTAKYADVTAINYIVLACTMACNMTTEFLYDKFVVFTTRPDTLFGATYCVLAPEHKIVDLITTMAFELYCFISFKTTSTELVSK